MNERDWNMHIDLLAWIYILNNAILLILGLFSLVILAGIGLAIGDPKAMPILTVVGSMGALFFTLLAVPGLFAGYGLLKRTSWARVLTLVVGFFELFSIPIGTAIGVYTIWVLTQSEVEDYFGGLKSA